VQETAKRIEEAGMEVAWDTAKRKLALKKLKAFFLDHVSGWTMCEWLGDMTRSAT